VIAPGPAVQRYFGRCYLHCRGGICRPNYSSGVGRRSRVRNDWIRYRRGARAAPWLPAYCCVNVIEADLY